MCYALSNNRNTNLCVNIMNHYKICLTHVQLNSFTVLQEKCSQRSLDNTLNSFGIIQSVTYSMK